MNEVEYLRSQVRLERSHLREVRAALSARLAAVRADDELDGPALATAPYLLYALRRLEEQDGRHCSRLRAHIDQKPEARPGEHARVGAALAELKQALQELHQARQRFESAYQERTERRLDASGWVEACREFDAWYESRLAPRRHALGDWLDAYYTLADWRSTSLVDAESVLEERRLHGVALAALAPS
jgi:hypothetical protein